MENIILCPMMSKFMSHRHYECTIHVVDGEAMRCGQMFRRYPSHSWDIFADSTCFSKSTSIATLEISPQRTALIRTNWYLKENTLEAMSREDFQDNHAVRVVRGSQRPTKVWPDWKSPSFVFCLPISARTFYSSPQHVARDMIVVVWSRCNSIASRINVECIDHSWCPISWFEMEQNKQHTMAVCVGWRLAWWMSRTPKNRQQ